MNILENIPGRTIDLERSQVANRQWMALLSAMFPIAFLVSSFILNRTEFQLSISAYYWTLDNERNFFVGILFFISAYLILYKGYNWLQDQVLDLAGFSAAGIAFFPMDNCSDCDPGISVHGVFAVIFFACIFYVCIFMSKITLSYQEPERRMRFNRMYRVCAMVMVTLIMLAIATRFLPKEYRNTLYEYHAIFWFEAIGIWAFSAYWYIKSRELDQSLSWIPCKRKVTTE